jgi:hypothetical protein
VSALSHPSAVLSRLEEIEKDLAARQNDYEQAAMDWYRAKRDREKTRAEKFLAATGTVAERTAHAEKETALIGVDAEANYEAQKAVVRVLDTRATIGQSILKAQGRAA